MTTESPRETAPAPVHDPAAWLVVLLALLIVVVVLGALLVGLSATGELGAWLQEAWAQPMSQGDSEILLS